MASPADPAPRAGEETTPEVEGILPPAKPRQLWLGVLRAALTLGLLAALFFFARQLNLTALKAALAAANVWLVLATVAFMVANNYAKAIYWKIALSRTCQVPLWPLFRLTVASAVAALIPRAAATPSRSGSSRSSSARRCRCRWWSWASEKIGDVLALLLLVSPLPWLVVGLPETLRHALWLIPLGLALVVALLWYASRHPRVLRMRWLAGLALLRDGRVVGLGTLAILVAWLFDLAQIVFILVAVGAYPTFGAALGTAMLVLLAVNLAVALPISPGNAVTHELGAIAALTMVHIPREQAAAFALLYHGVQTLPLVLAGFYDARALLAGKTTLGARRAHSMQGASDI